MKNDRLYELISRKLAGEATLEEIDELQEYFKKNPHDQYFNELITSYWNSQHDESEQNEANSDEHFNHILQLADGSQTAEIGSNEANTYLIEFENNFRISRKKIWIRRIMIAASFLTIVFLSAWFLFADSKKSNFNPAKLRELVANKGTRSRVVLPDSSVVFLNADTKLNYSLQFNNNIREVYLDGEAFFEVTKDPSKPFIVHTSGMEVKVVGTSFNVKAYSDDKLIETSLLTGSIEVSVKNRPNEKIILSPNEKLIIKNYNSSVSTNTEKEISVKPEIAINQLKPDARDSAFVETQWVEDKLVFRDKTFEEVATMMERWYNITIQINNDELKITLLNGTFKDETIEQALDALKFTKNFQYIKNDEIIKIFK